VAKEIPLDEIPPGERITLAQAAELLGRSVKAVNQAVERGNLPVALESRGKGISNGGEIWVMNGDGTEPRRLTHNRVRTLS
jgi:hypothetical protein